MESFDCQTKRSGSSNRSRINTKIKELIKDGDEDVESSLNLRYSNHEEKNNENQLSNSITVREKHTQNNFFDMIYFDKLGSNLFYIYDIFKGFFSNYFPYNDLKFILEKIELIRVNLLKRLCSKRANSFFHSNSKNFAAIHRIDGAFIQGGSIKINQKAIVNFNNNHQRKRISRTFTKHLNLKRNFFKRNEESPEEIKKYFRAKLNSHFCKEKFKIALKKIGFFLKKNFIKKLI